MAVPVFAGGRSVTGPVAVHGPASIWHWEFRQRNGAWNAAAASREGSLYRPASGHLLPGMLPRLHTPLLSVGRAALTLPRRTPPGSRAGYGRRRTRASSPGRPKHGPADTWWARRASALTSLKGSCSALRSGRVRSKPSAASGTGTGPPQVPGAARAGQHGRATQPRLLPAWRAPANPGCSEPWPHAPTAWPLRWSGRRMSGARAALVVKPPIPGSHPASVPPWPPAPPAAGRRAR
jgi:hypothetical protein